MMKTLKPVLALAATAWLTTGAAAQSVQDAQRALEVERYTTARATLLKAVSGGGLPPDQRRSRSTPWGTYQSLPAISGFS